MKRRYKWKFFPTARLWQCYPLDTSRYGQGMGYMTIEDETFDSAYPDELIVEVARPVARSQTARSWHHVGTFPRTMRIKDMKRACEAMLDINIGGWP